MCWTVTYSSVPNDLYLRWRRSSTDNVVDQLITNLITMDNGDGTYTAGVCASTSGAYSTPVFVQGGVEVSGGAYILEPGGSCTTDGECLIGSSPFPSSPVTPSPISSPVGGGGAGVPSMQIAPPDDRENIQ
jgi:hypothetical protein